MTIDLTILSSIIILMSLCLMCVSNALTEINQTMCVHNALQAEIVACLKERNAVQTYVGHDVCNCLKEITHVIGVVNENF